MINAVTYKTGALYKKALADKNILQTHEPFNIIVYDDPSPVKRDMTTIRRITEVDDITKVPTGLALLKVNCDLFETRLDPDYRINMDLKYEAEKILKENNVKVIDTIPLTFGYIVEIPSNLSFTKFTEKINKTYNDQNIFLVIEEDVIFDAQSCDYYAWPDSSQWHLKDIQANQAYALLDQGGYNSEDGTTYGEWYTRDVAIIDGTGFELSHPDLYNTDYPVDHPGRVMTRENWDCVNNNSNPQPSGPNDKHGTVMAGIAASGWADRRFLKGVGLDHINAQCLRIGYNVGINGAFSTSTTFVIRALNKAILNTNCAAIAMPYSHGGFSVFTNIMLNNIRYFSRFGKGMLVFAASGNSGASSISNVYPAAYDNVLAIGASTVSHSRASFSNYGSDLFATAPGASIFAIDRCCSRGYNINPDPTYGSVTYFSGTSASAVIAATIAATMVVANPDITALQIKTILEITARRIGPYTYYSTSNEIGFNLSTNPEMGNGILTQATAVQKALEYASVNQTAYLNYAIDTLSFSQGDFDNGLQVATGSAVQWLMDISITNDSPEPLPVSVNTINVRVSVTLETDGPTPTASTPMMPLSNTAYIYGPQDVVVLPGETITRTVTCQSGGLERYSCLLEGNYYFVAKIDSADYVVETSEEDNIVYIPVEYIYTEGSIGYCSQTCDPTQYPDVQIRIDYLTVQRLDQALPAPYTGYFWKIKARFTNLDTINANSFWVRYNWNPSIISGVWEQWVFENSSFINDDNLVPYAPQFQMLTPLLPGESRYIEKIIGYPPLQYPAIMTAVVAIVNTWPVNNIQPIHFTQSAIIYQ